MYKFFILLCACLVILYHVNISYCSHIRSKRKLNEKSKSLKSRASENDLSKATSSQDTAYYSQFANDDARIKAEVVRKLLRTANGASVSTKSRINDFQGYTYTSIQMVADINNTRYGGIPYFIMRLNDLAHKDLLADNKASFLLTESSRGDCNYWSLGSKDDKCHRATFQGPFLDASKEEVDLVYPEFVKRYPGVKYLNQSNYFVAKVDTKAIYIGDSERLPLSDYYKARPYGWDLTRVDGTEPPVFPPRSNLKNMKRNHFKNN